MSDWKYFTDDELACKCGECDGEMKPSFMVRLDELREHLGFPFPISSAYRCPAHNASVSGAKNSYHMQGRAVDIAVRHDQAQRLIAAAPKFGFYGIGVSQKGNSRFIHLDNRPPRIGYRDGKAVNEVTLFSY